MSRISSKPLSEYPWIIRWVLKRQQRVYGQVLEPALLWGRLPGAFLGMLAMLGVFNRKRYPVDRRLRSLLSIRVAQLTGCSFCVDLNAYNFLQSRGEADKAEQVAEWRESEIYTPAERAALDWAEQMTVHCAGIDDQTIDRLRPHFNDDEITALSAWIGFQNLSARFNAALGAQAHGFCARPERQG